MNHTAAILKIRSMNRAPAPAYGGFEQGPIRPPSESRSLLIRVTRNCPWNRCRFCPVYKDAKFSTRSVDDVKADIDLVHRLAEALGEGDLEGGSPDRQAVCALSRGLTRDQQPGLAAAVNWVTAGKARSVFLQDADSLAVRPEALIDILGHLHRRFPGIRRVTCYARSRTVARRSEADLKAIREAGLHRLHIGMESGSDEVLAAVRKGATKQEHITAGRKAKAAGFELSEYVMPGLGGRTLADLHARETADALNRIDPDFIRLRTLAIPPSAALSCALDRGEFVPCTENEIVEEIITLIGALEGIRSTVKSDHVLNLLMEIQGRLPKAKPRMLQTLRSFLDMSVENRCRFQVGRRMGMLTHLCEMQDASKTTSIDQVCRKYGITPDNVDELTSRLMMRMI